jgi:hypothetical protein
MKAVVFHGVGDMPKPKIQQSTKAIANAYMMGAGHNEIQYETNRTQHDNYSHLEISRWRDRH